MAVSTRKLSCCTKGLGYKRQLQHLYGAFTGFVLVCTIVMLKHSLLYSKYQKQPYPHHRPLIIEISTNTSSLCSPMPTQKCQKRLPSAMLIGVPKCGTSALSSYLNIHPDIVVATCPFHYDFFRKTYFMGIHFHRRQMPCAGNNQIIIEYNPNNFHDQNVPKRVKAMKETIKLIVVVRNPVIRTISSHVQDKVDGRVNRDMTFNDAVLCNNGNLHSDCPSVGSSVYHYGFKHWLDSFHLKQIHIVDGDKLAKNPVEELKKVEQFLGLKPYISEMNFVYVERKGFFCIKSRDTNEIECEPENKGRKHPHVDPKTLEKMKLFYKRENEIFFEMIGRTFDWEYPMLR